MIATRAILDSLSLEVCSLILQQSTDMAHQSSSNAELGAAIEQRFACKAYLPDPIPDQTLREILRLTLRAPTGFNTQPYACVLVRDQVDRDQLAGCMLDSNERKVKEAPVVVVFAADCEPSKGVPRLQQLARDNGASEEYVKKIPLAVRVFAGEGATAGCMHAALKVLSPLRPVPSKVPTVAWSFKQATFAACTLLYAAQAHGVASCPIEGFDESRLRKMLDIPDRYRIPVVVTLGYANPDHLPKKRSVRLEPTDLIFDGKFGRSSGSIFQS